MILSYGEMVYLIINAFNLRRTDCSLDLCLMNINLSINASLHGEMPLNIIVNTVNL